MMNASLYIEVSQKPDWSSDKSVAFDLDPKALYGANIARWERIFFPKSQAIEKEGVWYLSDWILEKKQEDLVSKGFDKSGVFLAVSGILGKRTIERKINAGVEVPKIITWFDVAAENLQAPKITFVLPDDEGNVRTVRLSRKGKRAKQPGSVEVTNGLGWGERDREWYGTVRPDGNFTASRDCTDLAMKVVLSFAESPEEYVKSAQKNAGLCCFCRGELTQERSRVVGYGPKCAKNYRLPW